MLTIERKALRILTNQRIVLTNESSPAMIRKLEEPRVCLVDGNLKRLALAPALDPDLESGLGLVRLVPQGAHIGPVADGLRWIEIFYNYAR